MILVQNVYVNSITQEFCVVNILFWEDTYDEFRIINYGSRYGLTFWRFKTGGTSRSKRRDALKYTKNARSVVRPRERSIPAISVVITPPSRLLDFSAATNLDIDVWIGAMLNENTIPYIGKIN